MSKLPLRTLLGMPGFFDNGEIQFQYPENWQLDRADSDEGWTVTVQSPGTAFLLISCYTEKPDVEEVVQASLGAMQQEYPELEADEASENIAGHTATGFDINFFSLDVVNNCTIRAFQTDSATFLILSQSSSFDTPTHLAVIEAIGISLKIV